ncbi:MAG: hypothetical protein ACK50J_04620, partial [Planctomyces sp.]
TAKVPGQFARAIPDDSETTIRIPGEPESLLSGDSETEDGEEDFLNDRLSSDDSSRENSVSQRP